MAWIYVPEPESEAGCSNASALVQSVMSRMNRTASKSSRPESPMDSSATPPSGMTCEPSTGDPGVARWILSLPACPVSHIQLQAKDSEPPTPVIYGPISSAWLAKYDRSSHSWKTPQLSLTTLTACDAGSLTLPKSGMMRNGILYRLRMLVLTTFARGSGLWPTPRAIYGEHPGMTDPNHLTGATQKWATPTSGDAQGTHGGGQGRSLRTDVRNWPTPTQTDGIGGPGSSGREGGLNLRTAVTFSTPQARDYRTGQEERWANPGRSRNLNDQVSGKLSVIFVEWLMGFPQGWTDLKPLETPGCRKSQKL